MLRSIARKALSLASLRIVAKSATRFPVELSVQDRSIFNYVRDNRLSLVSDEVLYSTLMACAHVAAQNVEGDFVECGAYKGGNAILAADVFRRTSLERSLWLFDTFAGMTAPTDVDVNVSGMPARRKFAANQRASHNEWQYAPLQSVKASFAKASLLHDNVHFVKGDVLETLRIGPLPNTIAVLRLDTDWYESTKLELEVLYPRLSPGGVLIVDDYGSWDGSRRAVDEYFQARLRPFFQVCDTTRVGVKLA